MSTTKLSNEEMMDKKLEAKKLYIIKGLTAVNVSKITGVSEKTIGVWIKQHNWKQAKDNRKEKILEGITVENLKGELVNDFKEFLSLRYPKLLPQIMEAVNQYLNR